MGLARGAGEGDPRKPAGRSPAYVYSIMSAVLVVLIAALTITAAQTAPPAIAELAPAAVEQIKDAPPSQTSSAGEGDGGAGVGDPAASTTTTTAAAVTLPPDVRTVPRTRKCVTSPGSPPRQTEDPQSPPCVPLWEGTDNGGATSKGVTRDEITVAVAAGYNKGELTRNDEALEAYFNKRFELYGRKLRLVPFKEAPNFTTADKMQGDAVTVDEQLNAFASLSYSGQQGQEGVYYDALARRGIISVHASYLGPPSSTEADYTSHAPYEWNYYAPIDLIERNLAEVICKQLVGKSASFAGPAESVRTRTFGLIIDARVKGAPPVTGEPLLSLTKRCGAVWDVHPIEFPNADVQGSNVSATKDATTQMQGNGVTTVVCLCGYSSLGGVMQNATAASPPYEPEYIVQHYGVQDVDYTANYYPANQNAHVFGIRSLNKALPRGDMPYWNAKREVDPTIPEDANNFDTSYWNLLLLASGIQLAGPNLTPETFQQGLQRAKFPNPGCGGPPYYQSCVGFEGGTHTMIKDFSLVWWDPNGRSVELDYTKNTNAYYAAKGVGAYCYADLGTRHGLGSWPKGDPKIFGANACR